MSEKALTVFDTLKQINVHDLTKQDRVRMGQEVIEVLPVKGVIKSPLNALTYALYVNSLGLNPLRKEMYGWEDKDGNLQLMDPYDLMITWAKRQCDFLEWNEFVDPQEVGGEPGDIVCKVSLLRKDNMDDYKFFMELMGKEDAEKRVVSQAYGVVPLDDQFVRWDWVNRKRKARPRENWWPKSPPKTWTWQMVARKRGMRNAIKMAYGTPSTEDIRRLSWDSADDMDVLPSDWENVTEAGYVGEQEAQLAAMARVSHERVGDMSPDEIEATIDDGREVLHGTQQDLDGDLTATSEVKPAPVEIPEELDDLAVTLAAISSEHGDDHDIQDGKVRFQVQRIFEKLGLDAPNWRQGLTVADVSGQLREFIKDEDDADDDTGDEPGDG